LEDDATGGQVAAAMFGLPEFVVLV